MDHDGDLIPSSPSNTSLSSSDLDTESTGSFFHDRSTTLGTLMGVTFPERTPSRRELAGVDGNGRRPRARAAAAGLPEQQQQQQQQRRRRQQLQGHQKGGRRVWWRLCRDDADGRTSLGEFLQVERRLSGEAGDGHFVYGGVGGGGGGSSEHEAVGGGPLFAADGRVLPPASAQAAADARRRQRAESAGRMPVLLFTGICSGGEG